MGENGKRKKNWLRGGFGLDQKKAVEKKMVDESTKLHKRQWLFVNISSLHHVGGGLYCNLQLEGGLPQPLNLCDKHISHKKECAHFTRKLSNYWKHEVVDVSIDIEISILMDSNF